MTTVGWFRDQLEFDESVSIDNIEDLLEQAKEMEKQKAHEYAEFAIRCDRKGMKILNFEDWIKLETFKSE
jgi:tRNA(Ser,Leu) C12 N-acetylase TAN1